MDLEEKWQKAIKETEIVRYRISQLLTFKPTELPYIFLAESSVNIGDTVVRKGKVLVHEASIILPPNTPYFEGFNFDVDEDTLKSFLYVRGVTFPSFKYSNEISYLEVHEGPLDKVVKHFKEELERTEDVASGLIVGPEDCWQFSVLFFIINMVSRSVPNDLKRLLKDFKERGSLF